MKKSAPEPDETAALCHVLEGEFTFFGLISTRATLPSPLSSWKYQRIGERVSRTVTCTSSRTIPHAHDVAVLEALLLFHRNLSKDDMDEHRTADLHAIGLVMAALDRRESPGVQAIASSLERLTAAQMRLEYTAHMGQTTIDLTFPFLTSCSYILEGQRGNTVHDVSYSLSPHVVSLHRTGELGIFGDDTWTFA